MIPCFGVEIEFYLSNNINKNEFENILGIELQNERGKNQFEIILPPSTNLTSYATQITYLKTMIENTATLLGGKAYLESKPFLDDYGNSMHFNVSFSCSSELNKQTLSITDEANSNQLIEHIAKTLCHFILETFIIFMPKEEDYLRIDQRFLTPTHLSYGGNNRTTAIRIPSTYPRRVEHRLPSISANPYLVMLTILKSLLFGLRHPEKIDKFTRIYGNAFDEGYKLVALPKTRAEAFKFFNPSFFNDFL